MKHVSWLCSDTQSTETADTMFTTRSATRQARLDESTVSLPSAPANPRRSGTERVSESKKDFDAVEEHARTA